MRMQIPVNKSQILTLNSKKNDKDHIFYSSDNERVKVQVVRHLRLTIDRKLLFGEHLGLQRNLLSWLISF